MPASLPTTDPAERGTAADTDELIARYEEEQPARRLPPRLDRFVFVWCLLVAAFVLVQVFRPLPQGSHFYLVVFLGLTLPLVFLTYRAEPLVTLRSRPTPERAEHPGRPDRPGILDWALAVLAMVVALYPVLPLPEGPLGGGGFSAFLSRQGSLLPLDIVAGVLLLVLVLEAANRTTGWVLPTAALLFFAYAWFGGLLPLEWDIAHQGLDLAQIVNSLYNEASGFFGVPLDVAATYIVLFTIYGSVLRLTGAGGFFVEFSLSLFRKSAAAPGRTVATSGFLLGTVSGSGTATAVTLGSFAWPILQRAGYPREAAGGMLAASGIGAILSPPTMGAAAFIIAEYLNVPYIQVLTWAVVPTILYYLGIFLAVEADARRFGVSRVDVRVPATLALLRRFGYHFISLGVIVLFLALDIPPFKAVVYATLTALVFALLEVLFTGHLPDSGLDRDMSSEPAAQADEGPRGGLVALGATIARALSEGVRTALPVIAVCAAAGVITSSIAKTGLAQVLSEFLVAIAGAISPNPAVLVILSAVFSAIAILVLGLAVPVTASFILAWVVIGPALISLGVAPAAVAMFIFYYAVLSEVSPPTALAAVASAAITGGKVIDTMWQACKYTLPAFLAPLAFVVTPNGAHLLLTGEPGPIVLAVVVSMLAVASLAAATGAWIRGRVNPVERVGFLLAAVLLLYLQPLSVGIGLVLLAVTLALHLLRTRKVTR
ncbi:TRAP transporter permease [Mobilicoccus massiliensis]|uniref:TRAP transporter permease n=1 Tax=Mobilicoccus massiliensis TaxID=1522310 RepID=UPI00058FB693|nr:TRAP transporter fused permease subunit [Mobilicoccus massiliensis]